MSLPIYTVGGLRAWRQSEIRLRTRLKEALVDVVSTSLTDVNQMWRFEEVDTPVMMPRSRFSCAYDDDDIFVLKDEIADEAYALRAETTIGSYLVAEHLLKATNARAPLCVYSMGQSFRQERSDGATAAKLRFNAFYQLEFQCIYSKPSIDENGKPRGTQFPVAQHLREKLEPAVALLTGLETRIVPSDRLPSYSEETLDIEVLWQSPTQDALEWKEVASTSLRTDFPVIPGQKDPLIVFEIAFGMDRLVAVTQREI